MSTEEDDLRRLMTPTYAGLTDDEADAEFIDIGHGVTLVPLYRGPWLAALDWIHERSDGTGKCPGHISLDSDGYKGPGSATHRWHLESEEPLTVSPSLLCTACGKHGWIRGGRWVPA